MLCFDCGILFKKKKAGRLKIAAPVTRGTKGNLLSVNNTITWKRRYKIECNCLLTEKA